MTIEMPSPAMPPFAITLSQAAKAFRGELGMLPTSEAMVNALLQAEQEAKQERLSIALESLIGDWQLCYTAPRKPRFREGIAIGKGFYAPQFVRAQISFYLPTELADRIPGRVEIGNQVQLGSLRFRLTGPAMYSGKKNLLSFDFDQMQLSLFGKSIYQGRFRSGKIESGSFYSQPIAKLPFFAFFLAMDDFIAARGRGGGLALWVRV